MHILSWDIQSSLEDDGKKEIIRSHETGSKKKPGNLTPTVKDIRSRQIQLVFHTQKKQLLQLAFLVQQHQNGEAACLHPSVLKEAVWLPGCQ